MRDGGLDFDGWRVSGHASAAVRSRGFAWRDVLLAVAQPEVAYEQRGPDGRREVRQRGHLAVVVSPESRVIITVLLRVGHQWTDADARAVNARTPSAA